MIAKLALAVFGTLCIGGVQTIQGSDGCNLEWKETVKEVRALRLELLELRLANERNDVHLTDRELNQVRESKTLLIREQANHEQQVRQFDEQLANPSLDSQARSQIESIKAETIASTHEKRRAAQMDLMTREAELTQRLAAAKGQLQKLSEKFRELSTAH